MAVGSQDSVGRARIIRYRHDFTEARADKAFLIVGHSHSGGQSDWPEQKGTLALRVSKPCATTPRPRFSTDEKHCRSPPARFSACNAGVVREGCRGIERRFLPVHARRRQKSDNRCFPLPTMHRHTQAAHVYASWLNIRVLRMGVCGSQALPAYRYAACAYLCIVARLAQAAPRRERGVSFPVAMERKVAPSLR